MASIGGPVDALAEVIVDIDVDVSSPGTIRTIILPPGFVAYTRAIPDTWAIPNTRTVTDPGSVSQIGTTGKL